MRYPAEQKTETHKRILAAAARSFREHGADSNGIGSVMKDLGLTKGGFYRHFDSKGDLVAGAVKQAFEEMAEKMVATAQSAPRGQELRAIIECYLSVQHANAPGNGCVLAALGPEFSRQPAEVRKRISTSLFAYRERLAPFLPGNSLDEKRERFGILFPSMAGVLMSARAIADPQARERMLANARAFFVKAFAEQGGV